MVRLVNLDSSSDEELPDLDTLLQGLKVKVAERAYKGSKTENVTGNAKQQKSKPEEQNHRQENSGRGKRLDGDAPIRNAEQTIPDGAVNQRPAYISSSASANRSSAGSTQSAAKISQPLRKTNGSESEDSDSGTEALLAKIRRLRKAKRNPSIGDLSGSEEEQSIARGTSNPRPRHCRIENRNARKVSQPRTDGRQRDDEDESLYITADEGSSKLCGESDTEGRLVLPKPKRSVRSRYRGSREQTKKSENPHKAATASRLLPSQPLSTLTSGNDTDTKRLRDVCTPDRNPSRNSSEDEDDADQVGPLATPPRLLKGVPRANEIESPRKRVHIPRTPHRPSSDAFWDQDFVNDWNDQHSPRKLLLPPVAKSPQKTSPKKAGDKQSKKAFQARKFALADSFLAELDQQVTHGQVSELAEATGGVKLAWTKTLQTTAGRASWRCETSRTRDPSSGQVTSVTRKHHASIELAEKVIDDEHRLLNVLAHEFCHLANFMISGVTNNPHGKEFKVWAAKCSQLFGDRGIQVTTKHDYEIDFKFIWACAGCQTEYKRHSRSINPERHRCSGCRGTLEQIKPVPRRAGSNAGGTKVPSKYQTFVKEQMAVVRQENPESPQKDLMKLIAKKWAQQAENEDGGATKSTKARKQGIQSMVDQIAELTIEDKDA